MSEWSPDPFVVGATYRVRYTFTEEGNTFTEGDLLKYTGNAYSAYHGAVSFYFDGATGKHFSWNLGDGDQIQQLRDVRFEKMP